MNVDIVEKIAKRIIAIKNVKKGTNQKTKKR